MKNIVIKQLQAVSELEAQQGTKIKLFKGTVGVVSSHPLFKESGIFYSQRYLLNLRLIKKNSSFLALYFQLEI